jgi:hypothetical protein
MTALIEDELLILSERLLQAIDSKDWDNLLKVYHSTTFTSTELLAQQVNPRFVLLVSDCSVKMRHV